MPRCSQNEHAMKVNIQLMLKVFVGICCSYFLQLNMMVILYDIV